MLYLIELIICPLLVGILVALFEYWLNTKNKK
ncbi:type I toxin-antitoxin system Fst family toxin [Enterococcus sp. DIV0869a]|uniref:Type I toxin-antitoxin system Fst family toxin n=1 Tax=Candidatus Enterococcus ikei TaxID=2815326 RepID=A0ABS3H1V8_9ENTE|nr:type I toxin-antitoxin system Fst family toxin [Enterococcus sp. DIV0869a]